MSYCSLSQKMSIGITVDSATKHCGGAMKEVRHTHKEASKAQHSTVEGCTKQGVKASVPVISSKQPDHVDKLASIPATANNSRGIQSKHSLQFAENQAPTQPAYFKKDANGSSSKAEANKSGADRRSECSLFNVKESCMPVKEVLQQQPDRNKETLRTKLLQILASNTVNQNSDNSKVSEVSFHEMMQEQAPKEDPHCKPRQNSDTIETDSENVGEAIKKPVTRYFTRKKAPTRTQHRNLKPGSLSYDKEGRKGNDIFSFANKSEPSQSGAGSRGCSISERNQITKRSHGIKVDESMLPMTDRKNIHQAMVADEKLLSGKQLSSDEHQLPDAENSVPQERSKYNEPFAAENPAPQDDGSDSPVFKRRTPFNSLEHKWPPKNIKKHHVHVSPQPGWSIPEKLFPESNLATEQDNSHSSLNFQDETVAPDEIHADAHQSPIEERDTEDKLYTPRKADSDCTEEVSSAKEVYSEDVQTSSDELVEKHVLVQNKRRRSPDVKCSDFDPSLTIPTADGITDDALMEALGRSSEDGLARIISLLGLALQKLRNKMALATNKRCAEILMSAAEEVDTQLQDVESQIQTDLGKLTSLKTSKRKHLETTLQEQQENLGIIHAKFKEDIQKYFQNCRRAMEGLENEHSELKGALERQKTSHKKLLGKAEAAVENHLTVAERRIVSVRKLGKQKMQQLKVAIDECLKDEYSNNES